MKKEKRNPDNPSLLRKIYLRLRSFGLRKEYVFVVQNLAVLTDSGMTIIESLNSVLSETKYKRMKSALNEVIEDVNDGKTLSYALKKAGVVPAYTYSLIAIGEQSGQLSKNLKIASLHSEKEEVFRSRVRSALAYSLFVLTVAAAVGVGISWFVLPQVTVFFAELDVPVPLLTQIIISTGAFLRDYGFVFVPTFAFAVIMLVYFLFSFPKTKFIGHIILFHLPVFGKLIKETEVSRLGFIVGSMLAAGLPMKLVFGILPSTSTIKNYTDFYAFVEGKVDEGYSFKRIFDSYSKVDTILPLPVRQMIVAAEQSGTLSSSFTKVGEIYESRVDITSKNIPTFLEPMLLIFIGGLVTILALGILIPIYDLGLAY